MATLSEQIMALPMKDLARLYDNMLERKIVNGTIADPFAALLCEFILGYVGALDETQQGEFYFAHDEILLRQFRGEE